MNHVDENVALVNSAYPDFERRYLPTDEGRISFLYRERPGTPLVLIPGSFSDALQWREVVSGLNSEQHLMLVELRGHGGSWPPTANASMELFAQDVLMCMDDVGIEKAFVGGHSIGGMIALEIGRSAPHRVAGIISVEGWTHHTAESQAFGDAKAPTLTPEQQERRVASRARVLADWSEAQQKHFATAWRRWDGREFLARTYLPVLEIYGDRGRGPVDRVRLHIPDRSNIELKWLVGASHPLPLEKPQELARLIDRFIRTKTLQS